MGSSNGSSLAEQGHASSSALPVAGAQQPLNTSPSIPMTNIPSRQESVTEAPASQNEDGDNSGSQASQTTKPKDWHDYPPGYPQLAAYQAHGLNTDMFRCYEILANRVLLEMQTKICTLGQALWDLDKEDEQSDNPRLKNLAFDRHEFLERCLRSDGSAIPYHATHRHDGQPGDQVPGEETDQHSQSQDRRDRIMEALIPKLNSYYELVLRLNQIGGIPKITTHTYTTMVKFLKKRNLLKDEAWQFVEEGQTDFFTTRRDRTHESFEALIYNESKFLQPIAKLFIWLFQIKNAQGPAHSDPDEAALNTNAIDKVLRGFVALFCGAMLLAPVAILLLATLSVSESLGVVVAFGALLVILLSLNGVKLDGMLIGLSAYIAVLGAFLSNLIQGRGR